MHNVWFFPFLNIRHVAKCRGKKLGTGNGGDLKLFIGFAHLMCVRVCVCVKTNLFSLTLKDTPNKIYQSISDERIRLEISSPVPSHSHSLSHAFLWLCAPLCTRLVFFLGWLVGCFSISIRAI